MISFKYHSTISDPLTLKYFVLIATLALFIVPGTAFAQDTCAGDDDEKPDIMPDDGNVGPVAIVNELQKASYDIVSIVFGLYEHYDQEVAVTMEDFPITGFGTDEQSILYVTFEEGSNLDYYAGELRRLYPNIHVFPLEGNHDFVGETLVKTSTFNQPIPNLGRNHDLQNTISITEQVRIKKTVVEVIVTHEDHDENRYYLKGPDNHEVTLIERPRGVSDGRHVFTFDSTTNSGLRYFDGHLTRGDWVLRIEDRYTGSDSGRLISWKITVTQTPESIDPNTPSDTRLPNVSVISLGTVATNCNTSKADCKPLLGGM